MATDIERLVVTMEARTTALEKGLKRAQQQFDKAASAIEKRGRDMENRLAKINIAGFLKGVGTGLVGGLVGGAGLQLIEELPQKVREIVKEGAGLVDTANKVGVTTDSLQELHFAATQGGASVDDMDKALGFFAKSLGEASQGSGELYNTLKINNVALRDQAGNVRPTNDLIRDYADLIKNARSEQERARITTIAFGRSGADLANVFRDGSSGIDQSADAFDRLGAKIDATTLQKIADIDDRWDAFAATLDGHVKSAVLNSVTWLDDLLGKLQDVGRGLDDFAAGRGTQAQQNGALAGAMIDPQAGAKLLLQQQLRRGQSFKWYGDENWLGAAKPTKLDQGATGRDAAAEAIARQKKATDDLIASMTFENSLYGKTEQEIDVLRAQRQLGASATDADRAAIEALVQQKYADKAADEARQKAAESAAEAQSFFAHSAYDAIDGLVVQGDSLTDVFDNLTKSILQAALQATLLGEGPLAGLFGASGGGGFIGTLYHFKRTPA